MNSKSKWCSIDLGVATTQKKSSTPRGDSSDNQIFVGGLRLTGTDQQLHDRFVQMFGCIAEARVMRFRDGRSRGFGFVKFYRLADYRRALEMQKMDFDGNIIEFRPSISKDQAAKEAKEMLKRKLILHEIPLEITEFQLLDYFNMYGEIVRVKIFRDLVTDEPIGQGYVEFKASSSTVLALAALRRNPLKINNTVVEVCSAEAKPALHKKNPESKTRGPKRFSAAITKLSLTNAPASMAGLYSSKKVSGGKLSPATFMLNLTSPTTHLPSTGDGNYRFNIHQSKESSQSAMYLPTVVFRSNKTTTNMIRNNSDHQ